MSSLKIRSFVLAFVRGPRSAISGVIQTICGHSNPQRWQLRRTFLRTTFGVIALRVLVGKLAHFYQEGNANLIMNAIRISAMRIEDAKASRAQKSAGTAVIAMSDTGAL